MSQTLEELPPGWATSSLDDVADLVRGIAFPSSAKSLKIAEDSIVCLRTKNVQRLVDWEDLWWVPTTFVRRPDQFVQELDILISVANSYDLVGKVALVGTPPSPATIGAFIALIRARTHMDARCLYYLLASPAAQARIRSVASTTVNISNVNTTKVRALRLPVPPRAEQSRIADALDELLSDLDAGVAALERVKAKLTLYRASVLKAAVDGTLTADWRAQHSGVEPASTLLDRILVERRRCWEEEQFAKFKRKGQEPPKNWQTKYAEPAPPDTSALSPLPDGWCWAAWPQIGFSQNGRPFPSRDYQGCGTKLLRPGNLYAHGTVGWTKRNTRWMADRYAVESPDLIVGEGELVINLTAQSLKDDFLGRVCLTSSGESCLLNQRLARLTAVIIAPKFMLWLFKSFYFRQFVARLNTGSLIQHMFTSQLDDFVFPLPPLREQEAIVEAVEDQLSVIDHIEADINARLKSARSLRQAILRHAFTGQLVPQDPNDEPASELLKRIAAEREARAREAVTARLGSKRVASTRRQRRSEVQPPLSSALE